MFRANYKRSCWFVSSLLLVILLALALSLNACSDNSLPTPTFAPMPTAMQALTATPLPPNSVTPSANLLYKLQLVYSISATAGHNNSVSALAISPDNKTIATGNANGEVKFWQASNGKLERTLPIHGKSDNLYNYQDIEPVAFSPDGKQLVSGDLDGQVRIWDVASGSELHSLKGHDQFFGSSPVNALAVSPNGQKIAAVSGDGTLKIWDADGNGEIKIKGDAYVDGGNVNFDAVAFSPDSQTLATVGGIDGAIGSPWLRLWQSSDGKFLKSLGYYGNGTALAFSSDGKYLATSNPYGEEETGIIKLWDVSTGQVAVTYIGHTKIIYNLSFSPDGKVLASSSDDGTIRLWETATGAQIFSTTRDQTAGVVAISFSHDGKFLASGQQDGTLKLWQLIR